METMLHKVTKIIIPIIILVFCLVYLNLLNIIKNEYIEVNLDINVKSSWKKHEGNPVIGSEATGSVFDPSVIVDEDGLYRMYISWRNKKSIALATSEDGINWSDMQIVLKNDYETGWEDDVNRATVLYKEGMYYMWYTGQARNTSKIGYATSKDGYNFERLESPIIVPEEEYEQKSVMNPYVLYDEGERIYKMWYAAGEMYEPDVIAYATSKDGINWIKYKENPIFKASDNKRALDSYKVGGCEVHKLSNNEYIMFYIGYTDIHTARILCATSKDGIAEWKRYEKPIVSPDEGKFDSEACYKPSVIYNQETNEWTVWYNGRTKNREYIGIASGKIETLM